MACRISKWEKLEVLSKAQQVQVSSSPGKLCTKFMNASQVLWKSLWHVLFSPSLHYQFNNNNLTLLLLSVNLVCICSFVTLWEEKKTTTFETLMQKHCKSWRALIWATCINHLKAANTLTVSILELVGQLDNKRESRLCNQMLQYFAKSQQNQ